MSGGLLSEGQIQREMAEVVEWVRRENPMAGSITNTVTINLVANAQLAVGGAAAMVYFPDEGEALAELGGATYINVGTLTPIYGETLPRTARRLSELKRPWVLDPVAVGLGEMRSALLKEFKSYNPSIIRGNASEVIALASLWEVAAVGQRSKVRGVETTEEVEEAQEAAVALARQTGGAVAVSGPVDLITDGRWIVRTSGGSPLFEKITGAGCSLGGVMALYAIEASPLVASLAASAIYNIAGARAERECDGPGSFQVRFLDHLYRITAQEVADYPFELHEVER